MHLFAVATGIHMLEFEVGQAYLVAATDGSLMLIDTGIAGSAPAILEAITTLGHDPSAITRIALTHYHADHMGSAAELATATGAPIVAHRDEAPTIRGEQPEEAVSLSERERPIFQRITPGVPAAPRAPVDIEVVDGDGLGFGEPATAIHIPGHTRGSIAIYLPARKVLFTGDTAASIEGQAIFGVFHADRALARASFRRLAALDSEVVCFGHGAPLLRKGAAALRKVALSLTP